MPVKILKYSSLGLFRERAGASGSKAFLERELEQGLFEREPEPRFGEKR